MYALRIRLLPPIKILTHPKKKYFWLTFKFNIKYNIYKFKYMRCLPLFIVFQNSIGMQEHCTVLVRSFPKQLTLRMLSCKGQQIVFHNLHNSQCHASGLGKLSVFPKRRQNALNMWHLFNNCLRACSIFPEFESTSVIK